MKTGNYPKRNRLIALGFVSVLLLLVYGPLAQWFVAADRLLYDQLAGNLPGKSLSNAYIVSINPQRADPGEILDEYGKVIQKLQGAKAKRIILAHPPKIAATDKLPRWADLMLTGTPVFVPSRHRLADISANDGFVDLDADDDGVLRRSELWHLNGGVMSPSLPLAAALAESDTATAPHLSSSDDAIYFSNYTELPRLSVADVFDGGLSFAGATVFVDSDPALVGAEAVLPSGQFVTPSELTAALLADIENERMIIAPSWARAMEWLAPVLLAIVSVLFMPDRNRHEIAVLAVTAVISLLLLEALLLLGLHVRIDLGRPILIFSSVALLSVFLVADIKKVSSNAFQRGSEFLAAGRLEPAFGEFRRCNPSETVASVMYKLSLAFEEQAKPERAEAVLEWMKRTHSGHAQGDLRAASLGGAPQRLGRYVIQRRIGRGAMGTVY
ncbi:MAG: CHASE2 domain-containing protein, partial [Gammaproteobacteria bacterium]|nr:CHASE2 domain-containing protein [Gammaproteobacteria bacterium]NNL46285.1 CHASE2 domain-containing protein [Woeseiaceae bacterium]